MKIHIKNGTVVDPVNSVHTNKDLFIIDGKISESFSGEADYVIDAEGLHVFPGFVDAHCHLRDPGYEYREDIETGTRSAAKGGFTSVACMPNTNPVCDNTSVVEYIKSKASKVASTNVFPIGAISKGLAGNELAEIGLMKKYGIVAISDDGKPVSNPELMRKALLYAKDFKIPVVSHCEDLSLANEGHMNEGYISTIMGIRGVPTIAESVMVARDILIAEYLGLPVHIAHVSTESSVGLIREAKKRGVKVTCETCPHYFTLTEEACTDYNTSAKVSPPLRSEEDVQAIIEGIADNTIDMIATDHAPHHIDEKNIEFSLANNGMIGFETAFSLSYATLVQTNIITLDKLIRLLSVNPSNLLGIDRGELSPGKQADIVFVDLQKAYVYNKEDILSKSKNSPFIGKILQGKVTKTIFGGRISYE